MTNFLKTTFVAGTMALTAAAGIAAVPTTADARGFGGGFHGGYGGFHGGYGGRGFGYRGFGGRGFGYGYGRGFGYRGFGYRGFGFGYRGPAFYGAAYPYWGAYRCGPHRRFYGACRYGY